MKNIDLYIAREIVKRLLDRVAQKTKEGIAYGTIQYRYALLKNKERIDGSLKALDELKKPDDKFTEYEEKAKAIFNKHVEKDKEDKMVLYVKPKGKGGKAKPGEDGQVKGYPNIINEEGFDKEHAELNEEYKDVIKAQTEKLSEFEKVILQQEVEDFEFYKIDLNLLPEDFGLEEMNSLMGMIK